MKTLILQVQYNGTSYQGWQKQNNTENTIEQCFIRAFSQIAPNIKDININAAGRTDKGVHATSQIASIEIPSSDSRLPFKWKEGLNRFLPKTIRVSKAYLTEEPFHARFDASAREYIYIFDKKPNVFTENLTSPLKDIADINLLQQCAQLIKGTHNFRSFQGGSCQAKSPIKTIHYAQWSEQGSFLIFRIKACGFLHHMVRYLVACQIQVAQKQESINWFKSLLDKKTEHHYCSVAYGLYFIGADYPKINCSLSYPHPLLIKQDTELNS